MRLQILRNFVCAAFFTAIPAVALGTQLSISINESGQPPEWTVNVNGFPLRELFLNINTPDGMLLEPNVEARENRLPAGQIRFEQTFESLDSALSFVTGDWSATQVTSRFPDEAEMIMREFSVNPISSDDLNRSIPVISSPAVSFEARNGEAFLLEWDFDTPAGDEVPRDSAITARRTNPDDDGGAWSTVRSTPTGEEFFSSSAGGSVGFFTEITNEPAATTNRWLFTATSNQELPQTFELQVGSRVRMDEFVNTPLRDPDDANSGPFAALAFSRFADPLTINLGPGPVEFACVIPEGGIVGDFDSNGIVEFADFLTLSSNFGQLVTTYEEGDANCDNRIGLDDYLLLANNFGRSVEASTMAAAVPEPSAFLIAICAGAVLARRRQRSRSS